MKPAVILSMVLAALQFALADEFKTIDGKEYKNATVSRVEPDGIVLRSKSGILKVYFVELPKEVQERFHYDAPKAVTHSTDQNAVVSSVTPVPHVDSSAGPTKWTYSENQDKMGRGTTKVTQVVSSNTVHFGFPYQGETHAALQLRNSPKYGQDVMLRWNAGNSFHPALGISSRSDLTMVNCGSLTLASRLKAQPVFYLFTITKHL